MIKNRLLLITALIIGAIIGQAVCLEVDVSSSGGGTSTDMSTSYYTTINDFVNHDMKLTPQDGGISNHQYGTGGTAKSITVTDPSGNKAQSYFSVAANTDPGPTTQYWFEFNPSTSGPGSQSQIWLTAQNARSISAWSKASNSAGNNIAQSSVSINSGIASPTTLASLDYWSRAYIDANGFHSEQKASPGTGNSAPPNPVTPPGSPAVPTLANGASGDRVIFTEQSSSSAGTSAKSSLAVTSGNVANYQGGASVSGSLASTTSDASASGSSVTVQNQESDGTNTFSLKSYASGAASYSGVMTSRSGDSAEQAISTLTGIGTVYIQDTRTKAGAVQQTTLYPKSKSFIGTPISWDSGHIIQDNVNLAVPVTGAANINNRDTLVLSCTFMENVGVDKSLIIKGAGADKTIVDGNHAGSVFSIGTANPDVDVSISGMKIQGGNAILDGGGILNYGRLTLSSSIIADNYAARDGGGIYNGGKATITGSTFSGNRAGLDGGGIRNEVSATITISGSTVSGNQVNPASRYGGGIINHGTATVTGSTISGNSAYAGGGIWSAGISTLSGNTISGNTAMYGGGVWNQDGTATITGSTISGNSADYGGGLCIWSGTATLTSDTVSGNSATIGGGIFNRAPGSITASKSAILGNTAGGIDLWGQGGGIANDGGKVSITDSTLSNNRAITGNGGGIANSGTVTTTRSTISSNTASNNGGGLFNSGGTASVLSSSTVSSNSANYGGGIYNDATVTVGGSSTVSSNKAINFGGGVYNDGGTATIKQSSTVSGNTANWGGGLNNHNGLMYVTDSTVSGNTAVYGGGGIESWIDPGYTGDKGKLYLTRSTVSGNTATGIGESTASGGGIENSGYASMVSSTISGNTATRDGGGINNKGKLYATGSTISGNTATLLGGGIHNEGTAATTSVTSSTISNNKANWGAGINNFDGKATVTSSTISGNAAYQGGGILSWGSGQTTVSSSTVSGNTASYQGGGIYNDGATAKTSVVNSVIASNIASGCGGGIYNNNGILVVKGTSPIINNQATTGAGGGIRSTANTVTFDGTGVFVMSNKAHLPDPLPIGAPWYQQYGVYIDSGIPTTINGFNPATQVIGNTQI